MPNESEQIINTTDTTTQETPAVDINKYLAQINALRSNSVPKEQFDQLQDENRQLLESLVNGQQVSTGTDPKEEKKPAIADLKKNLFIPDHELTDVEYVTKALDLRDRLIDEQGIDCFVGSSHNLTPTQEDYDKAEKVANVLRECLESCNGDNKLFIAQLQTRMNETPIQAAMINRRR